MVLHSTILLVDDNNEFREALGRILRLTGYNVFQAGDGEEALEIVKSKKIDLALVDIDMPKMDGLEFTKKVRSLYPGFHVIIVTGYSQFYKPEDVFATGAEAFLKKPVELPMLLDIIQKI
ncbi:MAG: response regulator [Ignavibacteriales bacterium]|nr:response regulator [Ignavibacteriales bacterium]